VKGLASNFDK